MIKDVGKSIRTKLLNIATKEKQEYMKILGRYFHERLLYRISKSQYKINLLLKGSTLLYAHYLFSSRPTIDVDLLGDRISSDSEHMLNVFKEILVIECAEDGVVFDIETIAVKPIAIEKEYPGINLTVRAHLDTIDYPVSLDIGFGDIVTPKPTLLDYPTLIETTPDIEIYAYSLETLIAEKFQTMIERDVDNSRMKDFYDVYGLLVSEDIDHTILHEAIKNTFSNRGTKYTEGKNLFTDDFAKDEKRNQMWNSFIRKLRIKDDISFVEVMAIIKSNLQQYWNVEIVG